MSADKSRKKVKTARAGGNGRPTRKKAATKKKANGKKKLA